MANSVTYDSEGHTRKIELSRRTVAYIIGVGLVLFGVAAPWQPGKAYFTFSQVGFILTVLGLSLLFGNRKPSWSMLGPKILWIPMAVIILSAAVRVLIDPTMRSLASILFLVILFVVYLAARELGRDILTMFIPFVAIESISLVVMGITGQRTGGILYGSNYDAATGLLVFGSLAAVWSKRWLVSFIAIVGLFFSGALEAVFVVTVVGIFVLVRRDFGERLYIPLVVVIVIVAGVFASGVGWRLYDWGLHTIRGDDVPSVAAQASYDIENPIGGRVRVITDAMNNIAPLGHGYSAQDYTAATVHNVPLIIVDQLGPLAALAWLFLTVYCFVKTKWKYAWLGVMALSVFDHFIWTMFAPYWWLLIGVSTTVPIDDRIFKGKNENDSSHTLPQ